MPILKYTASADTTITDAYKPLNYNRAYYANMGAADSLEIFSIYRSGSQPEKSRILLNFPLELLSQDRINGVIPQSGSVNFILRMYNVEHPEMLPKNYDISIKPVSGSWSEGYGLDLENYSDTGETENGGVGAGWKYRSSPEAPGLVWSQDGGDYFNQYEKIFHIDNGTEDVVVDITDIIEDQLSGILPQDGLGVMLSASYEDGTYNKTYYTKRFSARSSEYFYRIPSLEARWETYVKDDRGDFYFASNNLSVEDNVQNIYFYNKINGILKNLPSDIIPYVKIYDENNQLLVENITTTKINTGTYKASVSITGSSNQILNDVWYSGSNTYYSGEIDASVRLFSDSATSEEYVFTITNLKNTYSNSEKPSIRIFGRQKGWSPNIYKVSNNSIKTTTFKNLYYKIIRIVDNLTIIDYGVEPISYTKCSYDKNGNYFDLDMKIFEPGYAYGIKLMLVEDDIRKEIPNIFKFKVE